MRLDDGQIEVMDDAMVAVYRRMTTWQRLAVSFGMWDYTRARVEAAVRWLHPEWAEEDVKWEVCRRMLGKDYREEITRARTRATGG